MARLILLFFIFTQSSIFAVQNSSKQDLWKHIVTIDRLTWQERESLKKVNTQVQDINFVRRIYLDITGRIPTHQELKGFMDEKNPLRRQALIRQLLNSPGYVSHFSNFFLDLLRVPNESDPYKVHNREYTRFIERSLAENKPYDKFVHNLLMAEGSVQENPAIGYYLIDRNSNVMDTVNATIRSFLGTRIGCAQCHNHRFDKWTQKEFYETASHFYGLKISKNLSFPDEQVLYKHSAHLRNSKELKPLLSAYSKFILKPSVTKISFTQEALTYPTDYKYDNAKPSQKVNPRIVFDYGNLKTTGKDRREHFANWIASKENEHFAAIMANRLWNRLFRYSLVTPIDDWKDQIDIQNPKLFKALGKIFIDVNYDIKSFLFILFNSEAYQYEVDNRNRFTQEEYKVQGVALRRMTESQIYDSLLTLQHGNIDKYLKYDSTYFEFEYKLNQLVKSYLDEIDPVLGDYISKHTTGSDFIEPILIEIMKNYLVKVEELEQYYDMDKNGYLKQHPSKNIFTASVKTSSNKMMIEMNGSSMHDQKNMIFRANLTYNSLIQEFGAHDRSSPETSPNTEATMKQILKMMNADICKNVIAPDSYLMSNMAKLNKFTDKVNFLYLSVFGRNPDKSELSIAEKYISQTKQEKAWSDFALALINSPEFYFIK
jgi:hypothetical protein